MLLPYLNINTVEAGTDEAGRGCLAGPVVAAAVILPSDFSHPLLNDSKKVSLKNRNLLRDVIIKEAICYGVAYVNAQEIDKINILNASIQAMHLALDKLAIRPKHILVDGNRFKPYKKVPYTTVIKGDGKYMSIAAASILAKTFRDDYMYKIDLKHPAYNWASNMGYPTLAHRSKVVEIGYSPYHRKTFKVQVGVPSLFD